MALRGRLLILIAGLLFAAVLAVAGALGWQARNAILVQAEADGIRIASVLAQTASVANTVPEEIETVIGRQMVAEALLVSHLFDIAREAGIPVSAINARLMEISARSAISEIWGVDGAGQVEYGSVPDMDFSIAPDARFAEFWPLVTGERFAISGAAVDRDLDGSLFKYAGVRAVEGSGAAVVGYRFDFIDTIVDRIGLTQMVRSLLDSGRVDAILVFDHAAQPLAQGVVLGRANTIEPDATEQEAITLSLREGRTASWLGAAGLNVVTPIPGADGAPIGAALLRLPTDGLQQLISSSLLYALIVAAIVLAVGTIAATLFAHRITRPLAAISVAAEAVEAQQFTRGQLADVAKRTDEFGNLARVFETMAATVFRRQEETEALVRERTQQLSEKNEQLAAANAQITQELELAQAMQTAILPAAFPEDARFSGHATMQAARQVGGDFYDHFMLDNDRLAVVMADVSGKGVPAAFFMAVSRTILQSVAQKIDDAGACLAQANDLICQENPLELFVTVFYGILDLRTGDFRYANAGHNPPYLLSAGGKLMALETTGGMALGILDGMPFAEKSVTLAPGDALFLFTDGVTEAFNPENEEFGEERLETVLAARSDEDAEPLALGVADAVVRFADTAPQSDDLTMMALRWRGGTKG